MKRKKSITTAANSKIMNSIESPAMYASAFEGHPELNNNNGTTSIKNTAPLNKAGTRKLKKVK